MAPEYDLPESKFYEVSRFLLRNGAKQVFTTRGTSDEEVIDFDFEGEPIVIFSKGFLSTKKTIHISRDTADKFGEAGIKLQPVKKSGAH